MKPQMNTDKHRLKNAADMPNPEPDSACGRLPRVRTPESRHGVWQLPRLCPKCTNRGGAEEIGVSRGMLSMFPQPIERAQPCPEYCPELGAIPGARACGHPRAP